MNEHGCLRLHVLDARSYRELSLPRMPDADNVSGGWLSRDGRFLGMTIEGATQSRAAVAFGHRLAFFEKHLK